MAKEYLHTPSKSDYINKLVHPTKYKIPLKRSMSGYEIELALVNSQGDISNSSEKIIKECKKDNPNFPIFKEVGKNMIEITAHPHSKIKKTSLIFLNNISKVQEACEKNGLFLLPLGTYPGIFKQECWRKKRYIYPAKVIGWNNYFYFYSHCYGFHYHYSMPKGLFDHKTKFLKSLTNSKINRTLINSYNFLIAIDPIITTLTQSSPFVDGKYYAKDSRMLFLRGGKRLKYKGLYDKHQLFGGLPPYKQTMTDLTSTLKKKDWRFKKLLKKDSAPKKFIENKNKLDYIWNPVKINQIGTIEQRGMDTNYLSISLGISAMIKFILRAIHQEFYHVVPSDIGIEEPFKLDGNVIFIPPHTHIRNKWQYKSAYGGLSDKEIYNACSRLFTLSKKLIYHDYMPLLKSIKKIIDNKETVSDEIINYAKRKGYTDSLPQEISRKIALIHSKRMIKDVGKIKKLYETVD